MNYRKAAHVAAALVLRSRDKPITKLKLMKLIYLAERESLHWRGFPMIFDYLVCMKYGPVLSITYNMMQYRTPSEDWQSVFKKPGRNHRMCFKYRPRKRDLGGLSRNDRRVIQKVWQEFGHMDAEPLSRFTHGLPEYDPPGHTSVPLEYKDVLLGLRKPVEVASELAEEIAFYQALDKHIERHGSVPA